MCSFFQQYGFADFLVVTLDIWDISCLELEQVIDPKRNHM